MWSWIFARIYTEASYWKAKVDRIAVIYFNIPGKMNFGTLDFAIEMFALVAQVESGYENTIEKKFREKKKLFK